MGRSLAERLETDDQHPTMTAFPDGSVDHFYEVFDGDNRVERRETFAEEIAAGRTTAFTVREPTVEPGGHAVNMALQANLLGDAVALVGHLDHPAFAGLQFETVSMGDPARVTIYEFDDGDLLAAEPSGDIEDWSLSEFIAATDDQTETLLSADVLFCTNWTTFDAIPDAIDELATRGLESDYFVFDPGRLATRSTSEVHRLFDALAALGDDTDVVLAANGDEVRSLADAVADGSGDGSQTASAKEVVSEKGDLGSSLDRLQMAADLTAAVVHEAEIAVAATADGRVRVDNFKVDAVRHTGGGDRFDAGMSHALACGWGWEQALRLGNACAARYVATSESATASELATFLRDHN